MSRVDQVVMTTLVPEAPPLILEMYRDHLHLAFIPRDHRGLAPRSLATPGLLVYLGPIAADRSWSVALRPAGDLRTALSAPPLLSACHEVLAVRRNTVAGFSVPHLDWLVERVSQAFTDADLAHFEPRDRIVGSPVHVDAQSQLRDDCVTVAAALRLRGYETRPTSPTRRT